MVWCAITYIMLYRVVFNMHSVVVCVISILYGVLLHDMHTVDIVTRHICTVLYRVVFFERGVASCVIFFVSILYVIIHA